LGGRVAGEGGEQFGGFHYVDQVFGAEGPSNFPASDPKYFASGVDADCALEHVFIISQSQVFVVVKYQKFLDFIHDENDVRAFE